jgi:hypothetical protein
MDGIVPLVRASDAVRMLPAQALCTPRDNAPQRRDSDGEVLNKRSAQHVPAQAILEAA